MAQSATEGSSPLSRGIQFMTYISEECFRIIPALAGNTMAVAHARAAATDHPRSRGEYAIRGAGEDGGAGSSPLSRGIPWQLWQWCTSRGIIPALAGNTLDDRRGSWLPEDHPRSRGEYGGHQHGSDAPYGSSPLSRGIPCRPRGSRTRYRIIPALAGNTYSHSPRGFNFRDHPRSRGEYRR